MEPKMQTVVRRLASMVSFGYRLGPYFMLEILMPGGTLFALLLFIYRHRTESLEFLASRTPDAVKRFIETLAGLIRMGPVSVRAAILRSEP